MNTIELRRMIQDPEADGYVCGNCGAFVEGEWREAQCPACEGPAHRIEDSGAPLPRLALCSF